MDIRSELFMWIMIGILVIGMGIPVLCGCYLHAKFMNKFLEKKIEDPKPK